MATHKVPVLADKHVKVQKDAGVDQVEVHLKNGEEQVVWHAEETATISFESTEGSPFNWQRQEIAAGASFRDQVKADADGRYKYTVYVGKKKNDPVIIVHN